MSNGQGCTCNAWSENECACGADWTPQEVYDLRAENERLKAENKLYAAEMSAAKENGFYSAQELFMAYQNAEEELAEAKKDAEMFSFVKSRAYVGISHNKECLWVLRGIYEVTYDPVKIHGFDAAILSAMKGK